MSLLTKLPVVNLMAVLGRVGIGPAAGRDRHRRIVEMDTMGQDGVACLLRREGRPA